MGCLAGAGVVFRPSGTGVGGLIERLPGDGIGGATAACTALGFAHGGFVGGGSSLDDEHKFAAGFLALKVIQHFGQSAANTLLVHLTDFTTGAATTLAAEHFDELPEGAHHTMRTFVEDEGARFARQALELRTAAFFLWQESFETETITGQTAGDEGRHKGCGAGQTLHFDSTRHGRTDQEEAGVADGGRAGVADERHLLARFETGSEGLGCLVLIELVVAHQRNADVVVLQQNTTGARVFGEYEVDRFQNTKRAQRDVFEIANGGGNEIEHGGVSG